MREKKLNTKAMTKLKKMLTYATVHFRRGASDDSSDDELFND